MSLLKEFLIENADVAAIEQEVAISPRFKDKDGNLLKFKIRPMTGEEFGKFQKAATTISFGKSGRTTNFDSAKFNTLIVINNCVDPNFKDVDLIKQLGVQTPEQAVQKVLLAGELVELATQLSHVSGFDTDLNEEIENAKN